MRKLIKKYIKKLRGFTLLEILLVTASLAILSGITIVAINPSVQLAGTRNAQRAADLRTILDAIGEYAIEHNGKLPDGVNAALRMIGTDTTGCSVSCINCTSKAEGVVQYAKRDISSAFIDDAQADSVDTKSPVIISATVDPVKVVPGDIMTVRAKISDSGGVDEVTADMGGIESIDLELKEGDEYDGVWEARWNVHDTKKEEYVTLVTATDRYGNSGEKQIFWSDPSEWISPDSHSDPNSQWTNEARGYDGNTGTYASNAGAAGWRGFIVFNLDTPINSDRVRLNVDYLNAHINEVDVDVYKDGAWVDVFQGGDQSTWNCQWVELPFAKGTVEQARFRYNYKVSGYQYWLYEFEFYETAAEILPPAGETLDISSVEEEVVILHGEVTDDGGEPVEYRFEYGPTTAYGSDTGWKSGKITGDEFSEIITGLDSGVNYHYRAQIRNSADTFSGDDVEFFTRPGTIGWVSITGDDDPDGTWDDESNAYDDSESSYMRSYHNIGDPQWSSFIYFTRPEILSDKLTFYARGGAQVDAIDVDVHKDGVWVDAYDGGFADKSWVEVSFEEGFVDGARVRFHATSSSEGFYWELYELDFWKVTDTTTDACLDLSGLAPEYLTAVPYDPRYGNTAKTYYCVQITSNGRLAAKACQPELDEGISVER